LKTPLDNRGDITFDSNDIFTPAHFIAQKNTSDCDHLPLRAGAPYGIGWTIADN
jgi:hypothetical protein